MAAITAGLLGASAIGAVGLALVHHAEAVKAQHGRGHRDTRLGALQNIQENKRQTEAYHKTANYKHWQQHEKDLRYAQAHPISTQPVPKHKAVTGKGDKPFPRPRPSPKPTPPARRRLTYPFYYDDVRKRKRRPRYELWKTNTYTTNRSIHRRSSSFRPANRYRYSRTRRY